MRPTLIAPLGLCPKCCHVLEYNSATGKVQCRSEECTFSREYTAEDRKAIDEQTAAEFERMAKWDRQYFLGKDYEGYALTDRLMVRGIFDKTKD